MKKSGRRIAILATLLCGTSAPAFALLEVCTATTVATAFGSYNPLSSSPVTSTGQVTVLCTAVTSISVSYTLSLSTGGSGSYADRQLSFGSSKLNYNLYTNSSRSIVWGDGTGGSSTVSDSYALALLSVSRSYTVYAGLPALQNVVAGAYSDTVTLTVNY